MSSLRSLVTSSHLWEFLFGIAIFLYALDRIEDIARYNTAKIQHRVTTLINTRWKAILTGVWLVNILQSSSAVSLLLLALVGSGVMVLHTAVGIVIGMNVWSVFMEALVWLFGLWFDMDPMVLPMIAIGWLWSLFVPRYKNVFLCLMYIGLIFFGLEYLKDSIAFLKQTIDLSKYIHRHRWRYVIIWFVGTVIIQSSSAMTVIVMTALYQQIIPLEIACASLIGAYIGTTSTALLVSIGWSAIKKQVALSHFLFNIFTAIIFVIIFPWVISLITNVWWFGSGALWFWWLTKTSVNGLLVFFLLFKLVGAIIHIPLLDYFTKLITYLIPDNATQRLGIEHLTQKTDYHTSITILHKDVKHFYQQSLNLIHQRYHSPQDHDLESYYILRTQFEALFNFVMSFWFKDKNHGVSYVTVIQEMMQALKMCKDSMHTMNKIIDYQNPDSNIHMQTIQSIIGEFFTTLNQDRIHEAESLIQAIDTSNESWITQDIQQSQKNTDAGVWQILKISHHFHACLESVIHARKELDILDTYRYQ